MKNRIEEHPIIEFKRGKKVEFYFNRERMVGYSNETVAAALIANGVKVFRYSKKKKRKRGLFCAIGKCSSCLVEINGVPNQMACLRKVKEGMVIKTNYYD
jgi:sarcosine oxidase subunit alpha